MNIGNNMSVPNNTNFGMAVKFAPGTTIKDLEKYAIKHSPIKDEKLVLKGVDKMIRDQSVNKYMDIVFDANSKFPIIVQGKIFGIDMARAENCIRPNPEYFDEIGFDSKFRANRLAQYSSYSKSNPFRPLFLTLEKYVKE